VSHRVRQTLITFVARPRPRRWPPGELVLIIDGLWFWFEGQPWVMYLMGLKACQQNHAVFLDPPLWPGRETKRQWCRALAQIPPEVRSRIRALIADDLRGVPGVARAHGWVLQLCHFHLLHHLHGLRGRRKRGVPDRDLRERLYHLIRHAIDVPEGLAARRARAQLERILGRWHGVGRYPMVARECLRRWDHFRAYRIHPALNLPATTGTVEAMGHRLRSLMHHLGNVRTPRALQLWAVTLIRLRPSVTCNGRIHQPNSFV
jgi:hypothetical protein